MSCNWACDVARTTFSVANVCKSTSLYPQNFLAWCITRGAAGGRPRCSLCRELSRMSPSSTNMTFVVSVHLLSAVFRGDIDSGAMSAWHMCRTVLVEPLRVTVGARNTAVNTVDQRLLFVGRENGKLLALRQLLTEGLKPPVLVFVATKGQTPNPVCYRLKCVRSAQEAGAPPVAYSKRCR
eukprot:61667-Pelagomonas_calceolata.AAC.7